MIKLIVRGITWLCPCWLVDRNKESRPQVQVQIQMIDYPFIKRISSQQNIQQPLNKQKYHTPTDEKTEQLQLPKRYSKIQDRKSINNALEESNKFNKSDDFLSFKKSESLIKKSFRVIKISGNNQNSLFQSYTRVSFQNKEQYQQMISNYCSFIQSIQGKQTKFRESELLQLQRFKKRLIIQTQNQIEQFEYFTSDNDVIFENKQLNLIVQLKQEKEVFETKTYCTLCRFKCPPVSITTILKLLNSSQCQNIYNSFKSIKSISKTHDIIIQVQKHNNLLLSPLTFNITKFLTLLQTEQHNKIYVVQIQSNINLQTFSNLTQNTYQKITRIVRQNDNTLSIEIFVQQSLNLCSGVPINKYYTDMFEKFTKYFIKKLKQR